MSAVLHLLGAMAASLLVIALVIFGLGDTSTLTSPPEAVTEGFVREIVGGRYERALPYLGEALGERVTVDTLREYRARLLAGMGEVFDVHGDPGSTGEDHAVAGVTLVDVEGSRRRIMFPLERSKGVWELATLGEPLR